MQTRTVTPRYSYKPQSAILSAALAYGDIGWSVFPCRNKRPLVKWREFSTNKNAVIRWLWDKFHNADIGIDCWKSQLVIIDCDVKNGIPGIVNFAALGHDLRDAYMVRTPSGGMHVYYHDTSAGIIRNSAGKLAPGVDVRAAGGYCVAPPTPGYEILTPHSTVQPLPDALRDALLFKPHVPPQPHAIPAVIVAQSRYGAAALRGEVRNVQRAPVGQRNHTLNTAAFNVGRLVPAGILNEREVWDALTSAALSVGLTETETQITIASGINAGKLQPRGAQ